MKRPWGTFSSVQFSCSVVSDSLRLHEWQHSRPPCPSPTSGVYSNSCPLSWWCHLTISSSVITFSSCLNLSQHQGLFKWVSSLHQVAKVLEFQVQHQYFQWIFRTEWSRTYVKVGLWRKLSAKELMLLKCGVGEDSWESLRLQGDPTCPFWRRSALGALWKDWC